MRDLMSKYGWVDTAYDLALTVAVIEGSTTDELVSVYGGKPGEPVGLLSFAESEVPEQDFGHYFTLRVRERGSHLIAVENNGWSGSVPEIARRASHNGGRFFSVYWNVNGLSHIVQAIDGKIVAYLEPLFANREPQVGEVYPDWLHGNDFDPEHYKSASLAAMEDQTGIAFDRAWLDENLPTYRIPDPDAMLSDVPNARLP
ncbi:DUF6461 domain-containing protein [Actinokineospora iranica]|uniref:Uncharacterized protein n=1 Tax=Actinokineospora iranica TaxID=1271860 RepID=A0A1G6WXP6_9PSEU|nr:DUF6461 domain-containing protein [Actinokineospora iranica]SDD70631.1 hypothetical protein SAMN05216174_1164 [Actinokineospora iranica]